MSIFKFTPCHLRKCAGQITKKPKGGPLEEKNNVFKKVLRLIQDLKLPHKYFRNENMFKNLFWPKQLCARSVQAGLLLSKTIYKNIFSSKGPPFGFLLKCPASFLTWGVNLKIEISTFHQSFSFCLIGGFLYFENDPLNAPPYHWVTWTSIWTPMKML